jgi:selenocysteine-specific elongation factor
MPEKEHVIVGTAGHIDHGKSSLVKALTGIDPDALPEEKERGMTIELGFVFLDIPDYEKQIVFIDVPGHEKFVKTMVAGASHIDAAVFIIAADEGISVQTREHFEILKLLGVRMGIVALTKSDLVDEMRLLELEAEVRDFVAGSFLEAAPILPVSSVTRAGLDDLKMALMDIGRRVEKRPDCGLFRMPIDRVFTMHGFGTVVAGTILSGEVKAGDRIQILPEGREVKVRGVQLHKEKRDRSEIGRRTALNLQDVDKEFLRRGQVAAAPGFLAPATRIDARLRLLADAPKELKTRDRVRLHIGTDEVIARVILLEKEKAQPGESVLAQFVLESPTAALHNDRFIIRTFSPVVTIGGGEILDTSPPRHKRFDPKAIEGVKRWEGPLTSIVEQALRKKAPRPLAPADAAREFGKRIDDVKRAFADLLAAGTIAALPSEKGDYVLREEAERQSERMLTLIQRFFKANPGSAAMPLADLRTQFLQASDESLFKWTLDGLIEKKALERRENAIGLPGREAKTSTKELELGLRIEAEFKRARFETPSEDDVCRKLGLHERVFKGVMHTLLQQSRLVRLDPKVTYHWDFLEKAREGALDILRKRGEITIVDLKDRLQVSRKYACALIEHFDRTGVTRRVGDKHVPK